MRLCLIVAAILLASVPAFAASGYQDGNGLLRACKETPTRGYCLGYIAGGVDATEAYAANLPSAPKLFCLAKGVELGQLATIFVNYANQHPERLHDAAGDIVIAAIAEQFPCKQ